MEKRNLNITDNVISENGDYNITLDDVDSTITNNIVNEKENKKTKIDLSKYKIDDSVKKIIINILNNNELSKNTIFNSVLKAKNITKDNVESSFIYDCLKSRVGNYLAIMEKDKTIVLKKTNNGKLYSLPVKDNKEKKKTEAKTSTKTNIKHIDISDLKSQIDSKLLVVLETKDYSKPDLFTVITNNLGFTKKELADTSSKSLSTMVKSLIGSSINENLNKNLIIRIEKNKITYYSLSKKYSSEVLNISKEYNNILNSIEEYNKTQKKQILEFLCTSTEKYKKNILEFLSCDLISKIYDANGIVTGGPDDCGIDAIVELKDPFGFKARRVGLQVKCYENSTKNCSPNEVRGFIGAMATADISYGFMITTGMFNENEINKRLNNNDRIVGLGKSLEENEKLKVVCIDGKTLIDLMVEYNLGIIVSDGIIKGIDFEYFEKL